MALILTFLYRLAQVFKDYFGTLEEESIRDNFVIIYELLDETMDHGMPQSLDSMILRSFITRGDAGLESLQKGGVLPGLVLGKFILHEFLNRNHAGSGAVLQFRNRLNNSCFVRHLSKKWP